MTIFEAAVLLFTTLTDCSSASESQASVTVLFYVIWTFKGMEVKVWTAFGC